MNKNRLEYNTVIAQFIAGEPMRSKINDTFIFEYDLYNCLVLNDLFAEVNSLDSSAKHFFTVKEMRFDSLESTGIFI